MGITGLIPFLKKSTIAVNISQFSRQCVAIDAYCWLHKGAYSCIEKLARGEECVAYVVYCMKFVHMLLSHNIKPILVFDGRHLPAKAQTEMKRRESRELNRDRAAELLRDGRCDEARNFLKRCVDITHGMALALIKECRKINVDCIVAPYEADAQLAYLNMKNIAQVVITEDSDLVLFGCNMVMFKMDLNGNGLLVEKNKLFLAMGIRPEKFEFDKFRHMCILSGCDYLPSLPGIGLAKALKFVTKTAEPDIHRALRHLPSYLNMNNLSVTNDYRDDFVQADATFKYQLVYDPISRKLVTLNEPPEGYVHNNYAGELLSKETAFQLALGNLDPFSLKLVDDFNPDVKQEVGPRRTNSWKNITRAPHQSIWDPRYMLTAPQFKEQEVIIKKKVNVATEVSVPLDTTEYVYTSDELCSLYFSKPEKILRGVSECDEISPSKKLCVDDISQEGLNEGNVHLKSQHFFEKKNKNPFVKNEMYKNSILSVLSLNLEERSSTTENKFSALSKFNLSSKNFQETGMIVRSKYFKKNEEEEKVHENVLQGENNPAVLNDVSNIDYSSIYKELKPTLAEKTGETTENKEKSLLHMNENKYTCRDNDGIKNLENERLQMPDNFEENINVKIIDVEGSLEKNMVTEKILDKGTSVFKWENITRSTSSLLNITNSTVNQNFKNPFKKTAEEINDSVTLAVNNTEEESSNAVKFSGTNNPNSNYKVKKENIKSCSPKLGLCRTQGLRKQGLARKSLNLHQQNLLSQFGFQKRSKVSCPIDG